MIQKDALKKKVKLIAIGNSKGIRIPKEIIQKYGFSDTLLVEERDDGVLLSKKRGKKLSWEETFKAMAKEKEDWSDFEDTISDGLERDEP